MAAFCATLSLSVVAPQGWSTRPAAIPRLDAGAALGATVQVTAPPAVSGRRELRIEYTSNGRTASGPVIVTVATTGPPVAALVVEPYLDSLYPLGDAGLVGDEMRSVVRVTNTGNVAVTGAVIASSAGGIGCSGLALKPGESSVCRDTAFRYRLLAADLAAGKWEPAFTVTGTAAGKPVTAGARLSAVDLMPTKSPGARSTPR